MYIHTSSQFFHRLSIIHVPHGVKKKKLNNVSFHCTPPRFNTVKKTKFPRQKLKRVRRRQENSVGVGDWGRVHLQPRWLCIYKLWHEWAGIFVGDELGWFFFNFFHSSLMIHFVRPSRLPKAINYEILGLQWSWCDFDPQKNSCSHFEINLRIFVIKVCRNTRLFIVQAHRCVFNSHKSNLFFFCYYCWDWVWNTAQLFVKKIFVWNLYLSNNYCNSRVLQWLRWL